MPYPLSRRGVLALGIGGLATPALARWPDHLPPGLIFFVGNSFTRQHDVPGLVCRIAQSAGMTATCHRRTANGARLADSQDVAAVLADGFDGPIPIPVVLQDHSTEPLSPATRARSAAAMAAYAHHFQRTILFETWPRRAGHSLYDRQGMPSSPGEMAEWTHAHYLAQASALGALLAPVASAWIAATAQGMDLHAADGYHANLSGAWLSAMLLAQALGIPNPFQAAPPVGVVRPGELAQIASEARI